ncbi:hypothetical protein BJV77DRAFT_750384 [Russula vinacea]|nr:hypothetical protein BJV77DRAFT_750384 [Russula vinacea]
MTDILCVLCPVTWSSKEAESPKSTQAVRVSRSRLPTQTPIQAQSPIWSQIFQHIVSPNPLGVTPPASVPRRRVQSGEGRCCFLSSMSKTGCTVSYLWRLERSPVRGRMTCMHACMPPGRGEATLCIASTEQGDREDGASLPKMGLRTLGRRLKSRDAMASTGSRSSSPQQGCCHVHYSMILPSAKRVTTTNFSATSTLCSYLTLNTISGIRIAFITESEGLTLSPRPHRQASRPWRMTTSSFEYRCIVRQSVGNNILG